MSIIEAMRTSVTGMNQFTLGTDIVSRNIAGAGTEGYTRKLSYAVSVASGGVGRGVIGNPEIVRVIDASINRTYISQIGSTKGSEVVADALTLYGGAIGEPSESRSIANSIAALQQALSQLADTPESADAQRNVLAEGERVTQNLARLDAAVHEMRNTADRNIQAAVGEINNALEQVATVNYAIQMREAGGQDATDLMDQRDAFVATIAEYMDIRFIEGANPAASQIYTSTGQTLLSGSLVTPLEYKSSGYIAAESTYSYVRNGNPSSQGLPGITLSGGAIDITPNAANADGIRQGKLWGYFQLRDGYGPDFQAQVDGLASEIIGAFQQMDATVTKFGYLENGGLGTAAMDVTLPDFTTGFQNQNLTVLGENTTLMTVEFPKYGGSLAAGLIDQIDIEHDGVTYNINTAGLTTLQQVASAIDTAIGIAGVQVSAENNVLSFKDERGTPGVFREYRTAAGTFAGGQMDEMTVTWNGTTYTVITEGMQTLGQIARAIQTEINDPGVTVAADGQALRFRDSGANNFTAIAVSAGHFSQANQSSGMGVAGGTTTLSLARYSGASSEVQTMSLRVAGREYIVDTSGAASIADIATAIQSTVNLPGFTVTGAGTTLTMTDSLVPARIIDGLYVIEGTLAGNVSGPGLFTDGGRAADPNAPPLKGVAGRISVNRAVDPSQGGQLRRLRDGVNSQSAEASGYFRQAQMFETAFTMAYTFEPEAGIVTRSSILDFAAAATSFQQVARVEAETRAETEAAAFSTIELAKANASGVDIDTEVERMLFYERAYSASAQVLRTALAMLDSLIEIR